MCVYTETSCAFKVNLRNICKIEDSWGVALYVNATAFVGLKDQHDLANAIAFSSCKGLFGIKGAAFVAYKNLLKIHDFGQFYLNF